MWHIDAREYCSVINRNKIGSFAVMWMDRDSHTE